MKKTFSQKINHHLVPALFRMSLRLHWHNLAAKILASSIRPINHQGEVMVICPSRKIFIDDLGAMAKYSGRAHYQTVSLKFLSLAFVYFTGKEGVTSQVNENNYYGSVFSQKGRQRLFKFWLKVLPRLKKLVRFDALLSCNFNYMQEQELARACVSLGIPFLILHKEAIVVSEVYERFLQGYRTCRFSGTKILFYNKQCREGLLRLPLAGLSKSNSEVVGIPRLDFLFEQAAPVRSNKNNIVVFGFLPRYSVRHLTTDENKLKRIEERARDFFLAIMNFAKAHPEITVTIKTKSEIHYYDYIRKIYEKNFPEGIVNLEITRMANPSKLIMDASAVGGFNSTTLIEGLIAGKMIFSPDFGDIMDEAPWSFFGKYPDLVKYVKNLEDLERCWAALDSKILPNQAQKAEFLKEYLSTDQGGASARAENEIIQTIREHARKQD